MHMAIEIGAEVARWAVTLVMAPVPSETERWGLKLSAPGGLGVCWGPFPSEAAAREHAERVSAIVVALVAHAIDVDREERCANAMRENAELRKRLAEAEALCDVIRAGAATGLRKDELSEPEQDWFNGQINAVNQIADLLREPHSQAALGHGTQTKTALPDEPAVAPGSAPSSANSAASAVKKSDGGGGV